MNFRSILFALVLGVSLPAAASFEIVSKAHEVRLSDLRLPASTAGTLTFKPCRQCESRTVRVTAATQYEANRQSLSLEAFRQQLAAITNRQETTVTVVHHLESDTVKAVRVKF